MSNEHYRQPMCNEHAAKMQSFMRFLLRRNAEYKTAPTVKLAPRGQKTDCIASDCDHDARVDLVVSGGERADGCPIEVEIAI